MFSLNFLRFVLTGPLSPACMAWFIDVTLCNSISLLIDHTGFFLLQKTETNINWFEGEKKKALRTHVVGNSGGR